VSGNLQVKSAPPVSGSQIEKRFRQKRPKPIVEATVPPGVLDKKRPKQMVRAAVPPGVLGKKCPKRFLYFVKKALLCAAN
jgi:hypothetical protein